MLLRDSGGKIGGMRLDEMSLGFDLNVDYTSLDESWNSLSIDNSVECDI